MTLRKMRTTGTLREPSTEQFHLRLTLSDVKALQRLAKREGLSISMIIKRLIREAAKS